VGVHWVDGEANILWANKADYGPLGYTEDEYVGHNITEFHADADVINDILERLLSGRSLYNYEAQLRGSPFFVQGRIDQERPDRLQRPLRRRRQLRPQFPPVFDQLGRGTGSLAGIRAGRRTWSV